MISVIQTHSSELGSARTGANDRLSLYCTHQGIYSQLLNVDENWNQREMRATERRMIIFPLRTFLVLQNIVTSFPMKN